MDGARGERRRPESTNIILSNVSLSLSLLRAVPCMTVELVCLGLPLSCLVCLDYVLTTKRMFSQCGEQCASLSLSLFSLSLPLPFVILLLLHKAPLLSSLRVSCMCVCMVPLRLPFLFVAVICACACGSSECILLSSRNTNCVPFSIWLPIYPPHSHWILRS